MNKLFHLVQNEVEDLLDTMSNCPGGDQYVQYILSYNRFHPSNNDKKWTDKSSNLIVTFQASKCQNNEEHPTIMLRLGKDRVQKYFCINIT